VTVLALVLVLASALAHATWNYLAKASHDKGAFMWAFVALSSVIYLPVAGYFASASPVPPEGWIYAVGTMLLHIAYFSLLGAAYAREDLSAVYPVARGTGIVLVPLVAAVTLGERVSSAGALAIAAIVAGIVVAHIQGSGWPAIAGLARSFGSKGSRLALLTGVTIAAYSTWDKRGVSLVNPLVYIYFVFLGQALAGAPRALWRWTALRREIRERKGAIVAAAVLSPLAYLLVLVALTFSQVSYVAASREVGIVVGALLGATVLREPHGRNRLLGSAAIVAGIFGLALA